MAEWYFSFHPVSCHSAPMANGIIKRAQKKMRRSAAHTRIPCFCALTSPMLYCNAQTLALGFPILQKCLINMPQIKPHESRAGAAARRRSRNFLIPPQLTRERKQQGEIAAAARMRLHSALFISNKRVLWDGGGAITVHVTHQ
jgi:hypothetical protein